MRIRLNWPKIGRVLAGIATHVANIATIIGVGLAIFLFRQEIHDRLFARPILTYELRAVGSSYKDKVTNAFVYPAVWGMGYTLFVRNQGREPASKVEIYLDARGPMKSVTDDFSGPVAERRINVVREEGGIGHSWLLYVLERLPPRGTFLLIFSRADECGIHETPKVTVKYENDKGELFKAEREGAPEDFENIKAGLVSGYLVDCEMPPLEDVQRGLPWRPDMVYYVRFWARVCGIKAELPDLERAAKKLAREYPKPLDFGTGGSGVVCARLSRALKE